MHRHAAQRHELDADAAFLRFAGDAVERAGFGDQQLADDVFERRQPGDDAPAPFFVERGDGGDGGRLADGGAGAREHGARAGPKVGFGEADGAGHARQPNRVSARSDWRAPRAWVFKRFSEKRHG
jgi:hypothetical protein